MSKVLWNCFISFEVNLTLADWQSYRIRFYVKQSKRKFPITLIISDKMNVCTMFLSWNSNTWMHGYKIFLNIWREKKTDTTKTESKYHKFHSNAFLYLYNTKSNGDNLCDILYAFGNIIRWFFQQFARRFYTCYRFRSKFYLINRTRISRYSKYVE